MDRQLLVLTASGSTVALRVVEPDGADAGPSFEVHRGELQAAVAYLCGTSRPTEVRLRAPDPDLWGKNVCREHDEGPS